MKRGHGRAGVRALQEEGAFVASEGKVGARRRKGFVDLI